jgi:ubiquinol-cytochrome c reductase iron-sulfur subunit
VAAHETSLNPTQEPSDEPTRRDVILIAASGFAAIGAAAALWPLLDQMNPDESALSLSSTEVDISHVDTGQAITVMWRGKPIFIRHRTDEEITKAKDVTVDDLRDPLARSAAGSVPVSALNTIQPAASVSGRLRRTSRSRLTLSPPTPRSKSDRAGHGA